MSNKSKLLKLRAFNIENNEITKASSDLFDNLKKKLSGSKAEERRMLLNEEDVKKEEDLISDYEMKKDYVFGVVLRITHSEDVPNIPETLLQKETFSIFDLGKIDATSSIIYRNHYYFLISKDYVITNLQGNIPIKRLQVYLNWYLDEERGAKYYEITPKIVCNVETKLADIKKITVKDNSVLFNAPKDTHERKITNIKREVLSSLIDDTGSLDDILEQDIISAELSIKFKKPTKMSVEDYQKMMGAYMKPISETDDVSFITKKGGRIKGSEILRVKSVEIELTETNKINEPELYQEMEKFLLELLNENNI